LSCDRIFGIVRFAHRHAACRVERLAHTTVVAPEEIERPVVRDLEKPRPKRRHAFDFGERVVRARERLLHDVLSIGDRPGHARAIAMQVRAHLGDELEKTAPRFVQRRDERVLLRHRGSPVE
jgi:hypothetical protein